MNDPPQVRSNRFDFPPIPFNMTNFENNGVSVNEIKDILRKAGLTPVEQENIEDMDIPHEEL